MIDTPLDGWPSLRYVWRLHRFRPKRQLINLAGVLLGWPSGLLPGLAAKVAFDHISHHGRDRGWAWVVIPLALLASRLVASVLVWITLQFTNGAAYSYVVLIGTGSPSQSWARSLHAAQVVPLLETLLADLKEHAKKHGVPVASQAKPAAPTGPGDVKSGVSWHGRVFQTN